MKRKSIPKLFFLASVLSTSQSIALFANSNILTGIPFEEKEVMEKLIVTQQEKVTGTVTDQNGEPLIGVNVIVVGTTLGAITDMDGNFSLEASRKDILKFTYIGYKPIEVKVTGKPLRVKLEEDTEALEEVVVTAFGSGQKKASLVGSVQTVKPGELKVPSANLSTSFAGRMAGVVAVQRSGQPGADGANFWVRGISTFSGATDPLIILDGVQVSSGDLNALDPEVIEGFSILKDATATALYGTRGANGVMIVTTKSGKDLDKPKINFRAEARMSTPTKTPKIADGVTYMNMYNEAVAGRGTGEIPYTQEKINGTIDGRNSLLYPNINWYNEMFKNTAWSESFNFNIMGGGRKLDYFMSASVTHESGMMQSRSKDFFSYDNNISVWRYNFQNNINVNLSNSSKVSLRLNTQLRDMTSPAIGVEDMFGMVMEANPVDFPVYFPGSSMDEHILWGGKDGGRYNSGYRNPMAEMVRGYQNNFQSTVIANLDYEQKLDVVTKGLQFKALASFKNWSNTNVKRSAGYNQYAIKDFSLDGNGLLDQYTLQRIGDEQGTALGTEGSNGGDRRLYLQAMLQYQRGFGDHDVEGMFVYNQDQYDINNPDNLLASLSKRKQGIAGRISYAYKSKYMLEANFGYTGSENFAKGSRWGFFPSVALGYNISEEGFWSGISDVVSFMKIRGSWGKVGNDQIGNERFIYMSDIDLGGRGYTTGIEQGTVLNGPKYLRFENNNITWEVGDKLNAGIDLQFFRYFNLTVDAFREIRSNIFMERQVIPAFLGTSDSKIFGNYGKVKNWGTDASLDYNHQLSKDLFISMKGTFTYARNKILEYDEPDFRLYPHLSRIGQPLNRNLVYWADRLFIDNAEVANSPTQNIGGTVMGGDIKYHNMPNVYGETDGVIDANDRIYAGDPTVPQIVYGFGPSIRWKQFDFSVFFQGVAKTSLLMENFHPFGSSSTRNVLSFVAENYWSETNPDVNASYPRLSKMDMPNNTAGSTYWLRDGSFLKLKNAEVGYNYRNMRFYVSGSNLLTFSKFKYWDPEMGGGAGMKYPTQRVVNFGFQMTIN
ncbi:MAG: SusC/RagA family TonB-linked outer membrane protein [Tannerellaceae bacterium]